MIGLAHIQAAEQREQHRLDLLGRGHPFGFVRPRGIGPACAPCARSHRYEQTTQASQGSVSGRWPPTTVTTPPQIINDKGNKSCRGQWLANAHLAHSDDWNIVKVAVVDGFSTSVLLVRELKRQGVRCAHIRSQAEAAPESFERSFDPTPYDLLLTYVGDEEELAKNLVRWGVDRVVTGTESGVLLANALNHRLGLPCNDPALGSACRDKFQMAQVLRAATIDSVRTFKTSSASEATCWFVRRGGERVVVKPVMSAGTDHVRVCMNSGEVRDACKDVLASRDYFGRSNSEVIVQEYLAGRELIVNTVSMSGVHKVSDVWSSDKILGPCRSGSPLYDYQDPQDMTAPSSQMAIQYIKNVLSALGIREGAAHSEVMLTRRGPVLIETGARLAGTSFPDLTFEYSGTSHVHLLAASLLDRSRFDRHDEERVTWSSLLRYVWLINRIDGAATTGEWRQLYTALPTYMGLITAPERKCISRTVDVQTAPGVLALVADTRAELERDTLLVRSYEREGIYGRAE